MIPVTTMAEPSGWIVQLVPEPVEPKHRHSFPTTRSGRLTNEVAGSKYRCECGEVGTLTNERYYRKWRTEHHEKNWRGRIVLKARFYEADGLYEDLGGPYG